ncbi:MAG: hypothetical protein SFY56_16515 [Bacteroidota bacterium]|nr:hypothetical protein [Bacteroidota bacterium]
MKKFQLIVSKLRTFSFILFIALYSLPNICQTDTLHLYYQGLQTKTLDSNEAKIGAWAKTLKGKHVDVQILAYYEKSEYKKFSQERYDEVNLIVIRKARDYVTIKEMGPKKGAKSQRSKVDIVYTSDGSASQTISSTNEKKLDSNKKSETKEKTVVEKKEKDNSIEKTDNNHNETTTNKDTKGLSEKEIKNGVYFMQDTTYVNGEMKVTKRKIKPTKN